jgi:hypothetical protein
MLAEGATPGVFEAAAAELQRMLGPMMRCCAGTHHTDTSARSLIAVRAGTACHRRCSGPEGRRQRGASARWVLVRRSLRASAL